MGHRFENSDRFVPISEGFSVVGHKWRRMRAVVALLHCHQEGAPDKTDEKCQIVMRCKTCGVWRSYL